MSIKNITAAFLDEVLAVDYHSLPDEAIEISKQVTLDALAVMLAGATEPLGLGRITIQYVRDMGCAPHASVVAGGFKSSMADAAYANGTLAHALDWDNTWNPLNHPTSPTLPAILAVAEHHVLSGKKIIEAIVIAFEVQARLRLAAGGTGRSRGTGFHWPGTTGAFGATAAAAKLLGLTHEQTLMAFGLAGSRLGGISLNTGTMTKSSHSGHGARVGVECALLAKMGWTATAEVLGPQGFVQTLMHGKGRPELLTQGFGAPFRIVDPGVGFKKHPCNYFTHRPIDAALALREEMKIRPDQIERVEVISPRFDFLSRPQPSSGLDGKFSIEYTTLIALIDGDITVDSFTNERRYSDDVVALLPKVAVQPDDTIPSDFDKMYYVVNVWLKDGRYASKRADRLSGWVGFPLTREQRLKKYFSATQRVLDDKEANRMLQLVEKLEGLSDIKEVMNIARCERSAI